VRAGVVDDDEVDVVGEPGLESPGGGHAGVPGAEDEDAHTGVLERRRDMLGGVGTPSPFFAGRCPPAAVVCAAITWRGR
jgi:hypothetical protein